MARPQLVGAPTKVSPYDEGGNLVPDRLLRRMGETNMLEFYDSKLIVTQYDCCKTYFNRYMVPRYRITDISYEKGINPAFCWLLMTGPIGCIVLLIMYLTCGKLSNLRIAYGSGKTSWFNPVSWTAWSSAYKMEVHMPEITDDDWQFMMDYVHGPMNGPQTRLHKANHLMMNGLVNEVPDVPSDFVL